MYLDGVTSNIQTQFNKGFIPRGTRNVDSSVTDYNNMTDAGVYWIQNYGLTNGPIAGSIQNVFGWLEVTKSSDGLIQQKFTRHPTFDVYVRDNINGWKGWRRIDSHYVDIAVSGAISHETVRQAITDNVIGSYHAFIARISSTDTNPSEGFAIGSVAGVTYNGVTNPHATYIFGHYGGNALYKCTMQGTNNYQVREI